MIEWRDIPGFEGRYKISNDGKILSLESIGKPQRRFPNGFKKKEKLLSWVLDKAKGYMYVTLCPLEGKRKQYAVHRLVAMAFLGTPDYKDCVDHIDGNKTNNSHTNLRWCSRSENTSWAATEQRLRDPRGEANGWSRYTEVQVRAARALEAAGFERKDICLLLNMQKGTVDDVISGKSWAHVK